MNTVQETEFTQQIHEVAKQVHEVLVGIDSDVAINALIVVLALYGKLSPLPTEEFLAASSMQIKRLIDSMIVYPVQ